MLSSTTPSPFVKWAGGKRQLLEEILNKIPSKFNDYYEPFVGAGALLFSLKYNQVSYINDINKSLIHTYKIVKDSPNELIDKLNELDNKFTFKSDYYECRNLFNEKIQKGNYDVLHAALFIYLNKRCFNGLYRVNSKGLFNVPFNNKENIRSFDKDNILKASEWLQNKVITSTDFEMAVKTASKGDFVFFDSPYAPLNNSTFTSYAKDGFTLNDHKRLAKVFKELDKRGCYLMLTNHNTELIRDLYKDYYITVLKVKRLINSNASKRVGEEVIITNYIKEVNE
ncbi:DNA adenine methylase [Mycoplasma bovis]|uniref:site-specific DNA-methyltransferase (adenine-specific) n=2 Tax=Mycoplasmopsis bovis TaxID=28903 RepID=A0A454APR3_MYCBG|nr:DNA adenine methylase [Mycoplasmopsis bovis]ADR25030.1 DNA adenine methylase [Mycoplasmopsis bovis PG45]MBT1368308.1 DNA adenine methylase [Mycoplasmopsis bovis]QLI75629.1 DNA adenine methylase [Mycoplasmopsis bovis]QUE43733.1 DNA adenine methylase [Mycoplasmopsis bovis]TKA60556.1 Type II restriction modification system N6-adenine DNA methyltransferase [Mycoplasmopsis bovis 1067]